MRPPLDRANRVVAAVLAAVWITGALAGAAIAYVAGQWVALPFVLFALWYGIAWTRVAVTTRKLTWAQFVAPWRTRDP